MEDLPFNLVDAAGLIVVAIFALIGLGVGFVKILLLVASWVGAFYAAWYGYPHIHPHVSQLIDIQLLADVLTGLGTFVVALILFVLVAQVVASLLGDGKGAINRILGLVFGAVLGAAIMSLAYLTLTLFIPSDNQPDEVRDAQTRPIMAQGGKLILSVAPPQFLETVKGSTSETPEDAQREIERLRRDLDGLPQPLLPAPMTNDPAVQPIPEPLTEPADSGN